MSTTPLLSCWPTREHECLLGAALLSGENARVSWEEWKRHADIDRLDPGSIGLLPLDYHNFCKQGVADGLREWWGEPPSPRGRWSLEGNPDV